MDFITPLFGALEQGFGLLRSKEGNKYRDRVRELRQKRDNELSKPEEDQSDLALVRIERELLILARTFTEYKASDK